MDATTVHLESSVGEESPSFWAVSGSVQAIGKTPGEALDNLMRRLPHGITGPLIVLPRNQPDEFFTAAQQGRLRTLMEAKQQGTLTPAETDELAALIDAELVASGKRAEAWFRALHP
jgi:hypothetical protein